MKDIIEVLSHAYTIDIITDVEFAQLVAEDDALRARVEQAERERDAVRAGHDYAVDEQKKSTEYISELLSERDSKADSLNAWAELWAHIVKRLGGEADTLPTTANFDALAESATLTPRKCGTCAHEAAKAMRDALVELAREQENNYATLAKTDAITSREYRIVQQDTVSALANRMEVFNLPSCDGCNPLKPEAADDTAKHARAALEEIERIYVSKANMTPDEEHLALLQCYTIAARELNLQDEYAANSLEYDSEAAHE